MACDKPDQAAHKRVHQVLQQTILPCMAVRARCGADSTELLQGTSQRTHTSTATHQTSGWTPPMQRCMRRWASATGRRATRCIHALCFQTLSCCAACPGMSADRLSAQLEITEVSQEGLALPFVFLGTPAAGEAFSEALRTYRQDLSLASTVSQVVIVTLGKPVFDNSTNDLKYQVSFVPSSHNSTTTEFYKRHANAPGSPKVVCSADYISTHLTGVHLLPATYSMASP